ncbi:hypothetical protein RD792_018047 [Penstemon davidsonii]|uniref:Fatty acyl-CoA reductase n=1 Tax=Penstemon davidsonii TaxID=160366 RepID=A0ABR0DV67_9LAMI|nr:hypothetical protein RD792_018047 [Penstemon davidsonii]
MSSPDRGSRGRGRGNRGRGITRTTGPSIDVQREMAHIPPPDMPSPISSPEATRNAPFDNRLYIFPTVEADFGPVEHNRPAVKKIGEIISERYTGTASTYTELEDHVKETWLGGFKRKKLRRDNRQDEVFFAQYAKKNAYGELQEWANRKAETAYTGYMENVSSQASNSDGKELFFPPLEDQLKMELDSKIATYFEGKTIFITGATGFLAKVFLEKILRVQPKVKKLFLLLRSTSKKSVEQRLREEVFGTELFRVLREESGGADELTSFVSTKVIPVSGDVSLENLGILDLDLRDEMCRQVDIIVNSAATTKFDERYDVALGINAFGTVHVEQFARKCTNVEMLLHVSTAYVNGNRGGLIPEKPFQMGETLPGAKISYLDINTEKKIVDEKLKELQILNATDKEITRTMKDLGIQRAMLHGWPNTYVFTKAIGEMLLENFKEKAKVVILRPTIITSTYKEPFPGWIEGIRLAINSIFPLN